MPQKGNITVVLLFIALVVIGVLVYLLYSKGIIKSPGTQEQVRLNTQYLNPFEKETNYVNPFDENKNPFDVIRANEEYEQSSQ